MTRRTTTKATADGASIRISGSDPAAMNTRELIEYAAMDTLGLLDTDERRAFEDAFKAAPPHVQAEVRREQLRAARAEERSLPPIEPPAGLRFKVVAAVRDAINRAAPASMRDERGGGRFGSLWSSAGAWRVASLALASAAITLGVFTITFNNENDKLRAEIERYGSLTLVEELSQSFPEVYFAGDKSDTRLGLNPALGVVPSDQAPRAGVMASPGANRAVVFVMNLPVLERSYRVVTLDEDGNIERTLETFTPSGTVRGVSLKVDPALVGRLAVVGPLTEDGVDAVILAARFA